MSLFPETIAASLGGSVVQCAFLIKLDFLSGPQYFWTGEGILETSSPAAQWFGVGSLGVIENLEQAIAGVAPEFRIGLSGIDSEIMQAAVEDFDTEALNRMVTIYIQFFEQESQVPKDSPFGILAGRMILPEFNMGYSTRDIIINCESAFMLRSRPNYGMYTDRDQNQRYPGDKGFEFVSGLKNKTVTWPDY